MKQKLFNLIPPAMIAMVIVFWAFGPASWIKNPWSVVVAGGLITAFIQALEWVNERHAGWRLNKQEFATDLFYVILSYTVIAWASTKLAEDPLTSAKHSLGITTEWAMHLPFLVQVALVIFVVEFGQYWMHRLMHNNAFFWSTHAPHHHITQLNAMKGQQDLRHNELKGHQALVQGEQKHQMMLKQAAQKPKPAGGAGGR